MFFNVKIFNCKKLNRNIREPKEEESILDSRLGVCVKQKMRARVTPIQRLLVGMVTGF